MFFRFLLLLLCLTFNVKAQEDLLIKELLDGIADELAEDLDLSELNERFLYFKKHPINLNKTNSQELKNLFFLSPLQIANFFTYLSANGKLIDILELQAIPGFDSKTVQKLLHFVQIKDSDLIEETTFKNLLKFGDNDLVIRYGIIVEKQKGFRDLTGSRYLGTPEKLLLRYKYNFTNRISFSLIAEKDAGEKLTPFITTNFTINNIGKIKKLSIGDYSLQFGQGLTLWSGFGFGKGPDVTSIAKKDDGLKPYSSANEFSFFRGIGTKIEITKRIDLTSFLSYRMHDASIKKGAQGEEVIETLNETGYHRTISEINSKNSVTQKIYGAVLEYHENTLNIGLISYQSHYSKSFITNEQPYKLFNFTGNVLTNLGFHFNYTFKNTYFFGEIAKSINSGTALMQGLLLSLANKVSAVFLYRNYQKNYHNFFNQAPAESNGFNENGFYTGFNITPSKSWVLSLYADYFKFPWLKFRIDAPSQGYELLALLTYTPSKTLKVNARYKSELKQQNTDLTVPINFLENIQTQSFRGEVNWRLTKEIGLQNKVEVSKYQKAEHLPEFGYLIYQDLSISSSRSKLSGNLRLAYFNTPSYNSRIYAYEDDVLYNFSFGMYSGTGIRSYINLKYKFLRGLDLWSRYAIFYYRKVDHIGSGLDEIKGQKKSEVKFQLRYQF